MPNALAVSGDRIDVTDTWHSSLVQVTARDTAVVDTDAANCPPRVTITEAGCHMIQVAAVDPDNDTVTYRRHNRSAERWTISATACSSARPMPLQSSAVSSIDSPSPSTTATAGWSPRPSH
jgi:hypothetical protein